MIAWKTLDGKDRMQCVKSCGDHWCNKYYPVSIGMIKSHAYHTRPYEYCTMKEGKGHASVTDVSLPLKLYIRESGGEVCGWRTEGGVQLANLPPSTHTQLKFRFIYITITVHVDINVTGLLEEEGQSSHSSQSALEGRPHHVNTTLALWSVGWRRRGAPWLMASWAIKKTKPLNHALLAVCMYPWQVTGS